MGLAFGYCCGGEQPYRRTVVCSLLQCDDLLALSLEKFDPLSGWSFCRVAYGCVVVEVWVIFFRANSSLWGDWLLLSYLWKQLDDSSSCCLANATMQLLVRLLSCDYNLQGA